MLEVSLLCWPRHLYTVRRKAFDGMFQTLCINSSLVERERRRDGWRTGEGLWAAASLTAASPLCRHACQEPLETGRDSASLTSSKVCCSAILADGRMEFTNLHRVKTQSSKQLRKQVCKVAVASTHFTSEARTEEWRRVDTGHHSKGWVGCSMKHVCARKHSGNTDYSITSQVHYQNSTS